jgi:hypothetical protein
MVTAARARGRCNGHRSCLLSPGVPLGLNLTEEERLYLLQLLGKPYERFYPCGGMRDSDPASGVAASGTCRRSEARASLDVEERILPCQPLRWHLDPRS